MKHFSLLHSLLFSLLIAIFSLSSASNIDPLTLPRHLIREFSSSSVEKIESKREREDLLIRCGSWRFASEANNLRPWQTIPAECGDYVKEYATGRAYLSDLEMVASESLDFARSVILAGDGKDAWIFDIDETLLSNLPYYADHGFGLEVFDGHKFDKWVDEAIAPAIQSSLELYEEVLSLGFKIILLTGRSEDQRSTTINNLKRAGYHDWERLILRGVDDRGKHATKYKSEKRSEVVAEGYRIHGNSGDQWSDLLGYSTSNRSFKLPNPMYYIA